MPISRDLGQGADDPDTEMTSMAKLSVTHPQAESIEFFRQATTQAVAYRLSLAQREAANYKVLEDELPNLWETLRWIYERKAWDLIVAFREALQPFLDLRGYWVQSLMLNEWARQAAQILGDAVSAARWTHDQADILQQQGRYQEAEELYQASEEAYRILNEDEMSLRSRHMRSLVVRAQGRQAKAESLCETTISGARELGLDLWLAHPLYVRGLLARDRGDFQRAKQSIEDSLSLLADTDEQAMIAQCQHFLGELALRQGALVEARAHLNASLQLSRQVGILRRVTTAQRALGDLARLEGRYREAEQAYHEAFTMATKLGDQPQVAQLFLSQARLKAKLGQATSEADSLQGALSMYEQIQDARGVAVACLLLARWYLWQRQWRPALQMTLRAFTMVRLVNIHNPWALLNLLRYWRKP